ncbi:MAG: cupin [Arenibacter latericius]|nr:cupin [Arenibacter latericius]
MTTASITENLVYNENKPAVTKLMETSTTKEIRILMRKGQLMKEHTAPFPIVVSLFEGSVDFGVNGEIQQLKKGDLIALKENVPHDLLCTEDCIIRLSLSKLDTVKRVESVA